MNVTIENCNNIKNANIDIEKNKINILYGSNGVGKSTIAKCIKAYEDGNDFSEFKSLLYNNKPNVVIDTDFRGCSIFNQEFINNIIFKEDEFFKDNYELMIKTEKIEETEITINNIANEIKENLNLDKTQKVIDSIAYIADAYSVNKTDKSYYKSLNKSKKGFKALNQDNPLSIPNANTSFRLAMSSQLDKVKWGKWWKEGAKYIQGRRCPYCGSKHKTDFKSKMESFSNIINHTNLEVRLKSFESAETLTGIIDYDKDFFQSFMNSKKSLATEANARKLYKFVENTIKINELVTNLKQLSTDTVESVNQLSNYKKTLNLLDSSSELYTSLSSCINKLEIEKSKLNGLKRKIKKTIETNLEKNQETVNNFLKLAGISYQLSIEENKLTLLHSSLTKIDKLNNHLSYGERNAISLILFALMYKNEKDVLILDDPLSSYDSDKKYALLVMLFAKDQMRLTFKNHVLLLTHDFDLIIDLVKNGKPVNNVTCNMVHNSKGQLFTTEITSKDLLLIKSNYKKIIRKSNLLSVKLIYLRKLIELKIETDSNNLTYNYISSVLKGNTPRIGKNTNQTGRLMTQKEISSAENKIKKYISSYLLEDLNDELKIENLLSIYDQLSWYEKLVSFRLINEYCINNNITTSFDNSIYRYATMVYHIENERIFDLDIEKFNTASSHVEDHLTIYVSELRSLFNI